ncbi:hypothetical protein DENIS_0775 [Desulfonema ishimotonii]|uniref:Uncharacterized protein n=1 Tax=Desulfonema ishimotonii TaxID=45657 RepID=A0A401FS91_9BACT|nr:hypothetical protein [Desulfonema ishimotonii]GBC59834.1 hypothetical protein DENIS_0775 [Desulfonema ishimotonii]
MASNEPAGGIRQVAQAVVELEKGIQDNLKANEDLPNQAEQLRKTATYFKTGRSEKHIQENAVHSFPASFGRHRPEKNP